MSISQQTLTVRYSELKDAARLMELDELVWKPGNAPEALEWHSLEHYLLQCPPGSQLVAVRGDEILGYIGFREPTGMESNRHVYELNIAVHPSHRRKGLGRILIEELKVLAQLRGKSKLRLRVLSSNPGAIAFYKVCGFKEEGRLVKEYYLDGRYVDDVLMSYFL